jgi:hypothetical protein
MSTSSNWDNVGLMNHSIIRLGDVISPTSLQVIHNCRALTSIIQNLSKYSVNLTSFYKIWLKRKSPISIIQNLSKYSVNFTSFYKIWLKWKFSPNNTKFYKILR